MEFKDRVTELRIEKNMTQVQLAVLLNKTEGAIRAWESGRAKPDCNTLIKLSEYFGVTTDYLLGASNDATPTPNSCMTISEKIRYYRKQKNMTQKELSTATGIAEITIRQYEADKYKPKIEQLEKLAIAFNVPITTLIELHNSLEVKNILSKTPSNNLNPKKFQAIADDVEEIIKLLQKIKKEIGEI